MFRKGVDIADDTFGIDGEANCCFLVAFTLELDGVVIEEPNKERGVEGAIYVWVTALDGNRPGGAPRAYRLPYLKDTHSQLSESQRKSRNGVRQVGSIERSGGGTGNAWFKINPDNKIKLRVSDAPATRLPEK